MRRVHDEGVRERQRQRSGVKHDHDDPKPKLRADGKRSWCCPTAMKIAREQGKFDNGEYVGEYR